MKSKLRFSDVGFLFVFSMFFCVVIGILLSYQYDFSKNFDLLFGSDTTRVIGDITEFSYNHYRVSVHPLFILLLQPLYYLVRGIFINKMLSLVVISSLATSITVVFIYKILSLYSDKKKLNILVSLCYLFSFSNFVFTAGIESYNFATLFLVIFLYYALLYFDKKKISYFVFLILGILCYGVTITNIMIFLIVMFVLFLFKKFSFLDYILYSCGVMLLAFLLVFVQHFIWTSVQIGVDNVVNVIKNDYSYSIIGSDIYVKSIDHKNYNNVNNFTISFYNYNLINSIIVFVFYVFAIILFIRNYKDSLFANICIVLCLLFNSLLHIVYGNAESFLYSLHFVYLIFIGLGINLGK